MAEIDFLRLFLSTQRRHFLSIYTYLMPLMPGMTLLVFYEKLTTGPKTREDPFSTFSYHSILFLPILKSPPRYVPKSPLTLLDTVLTHPEPYGVVLVIGDIPQKSSDTLVNCRCLELPTSVVACPHVAGHCCWQLCRCQTKVRCHVLFFNSHHHPFSARSPRQQQVLFLNFFPNILTRQFSPQQRRNRWKT